MKKNKFKKIILSVILFLPLVLGNFASASEVTGTLSTASNSVGNTLTGIVVAPSSSGSNSGGGGGGGHSSSQHPSQTNLSGTDINGDGRTDILDFVYLMANWNKTGSGIAGDFNGDGHVDILDFVYLMTNWTI